MIRQRTQRPSGTFLQRLVPPPPSSSTTQLAALFPLKPVSKSKRSSRGCPIPDANCAVVVRACVVFFTGACGSNRRRASSHAVSRPGAMEHVVEEVAPVVYPDCLLESGPFLCAGGFAYGIDCRLFRNSSPRLAPSLKPCGLIDAATNEASIEVSFHLYRPCSRRRLGHVF